MEKHKDLPVLFCETPEEFEIWLQQNLETKGVWLKFAKKASGITSLNYDGALQVALCYGWIDGLVNPLNETYYLQKFTPRRSKSTWSTRNIKYVEALIAAGKMQPSGQKQIDTAKADGRWGNAYAGQASFVMPQDFLDELAKHPNAATFYETLNRTNKFAIYFQLTNAKKPETRTRRIQKYITMLESSEKPY